MTAASLPAAGPVNERVAAALNDVIADATTAGAEHLAERMRLEASRWRSKETTVVVAGEPNRGKSSLVNALLGRQLLPTGANATTTAYVVVRYGETEGATVHRTGESTESVSIDRVGDLAVARPSEGIEGITVTLDHPMLRNGLTLVDTPGVGGLDEAHGRITMSMLSRADALVFLLDPAEPLSHSELEFLTRATDRLDRVLFVMTRIDRAGGYRTIADDDRALIAKHAPELVNASIVPVSSRLKQAADEQAASGSVDTTLLNESGIPELGRSILRSIVARIATVRLANLLRLSVAVVTELERPWRDTIEASEGEPEAKEVAARTQQAIDDLRDASERMSVDVTDRFNAMREEASTDLNRIVRDLTAKFGSAAPGGSAPPSDEAALGEVRAELAAAVGELGERLTDQIDVLRGDVDAAIGGLDVELPPILLTSTAVRVDEQVTPPNEVSDQSLRVRIFSAVGSCVGAMGMFGLRLTQGGPNPSAADRTLTYALGAAALMSVGAAVMNLRVMNRQNHATAMRRQVQTALDAGRLDVAPMIRQQLLGAQRELERAMRSEVRGRTKDLQQTLADTTQLLRADTAKRQQMREGAQRALGALAARRRQLDALAAEVAALRDGASR